ncbi:DUF2063 domain-containing protein [Candidatus Trichorickettsia mobilis]|uniref:DUF2063 domain-containing protein n=1 Tax=Candidatus Trichorickettsia mobilis TaxID=1346319 RepID=A0ABZ0UUG7_9RICK|nr:putative DNA-binding domain-containing protein [Candidatus Trichorickettsia mobilis]WPY01246.1 DUF2063 domain-containing protein [Candidatus Trichorickettsia mobilis]
MLLREWQINFKNFICDQEAVNFVAMPLTGLDIYKANYFAKLTMALKNKFTNTAKYLQDRFAKLAFKYIFLHQSTSGNLDEYGNLFPTFLKENDLALASDLASIDLMIFNTVTNYAANVFDSSQANNVIIEDLGRLYFILNKAVNLAQVSRGAYQLWEVIAEDKLIINEIDPEVQGLISYPKQFKAVLKSINIEEYHWFKAVQQNKNILAATEIALIYDSQFELNQILNFCFKHKLVSEIFYQKET